MDVSFRSRLGIRRQSSRVVKISPLTFFLGDMDLLASDLSNWKVKGEIIAVFHGDAAFVVLNDNSYDANRRVQTGHPVKTGNPYGKLIAGFRQVVARPENLEIFKWYSFIAPIVADWVRQAGSISKNERFSAGQSPGELPELLAEQYLNIRALFDFLLKDRTFRSGIATR